nr:hypothetical protein BCU65_13515 [Vibrio cyclitrophicus]
MSYDQKVKVKARKLVLKKAIEELTVNRQNSTLVGKYHVRNVREQLISQGDLAENTLSDSVLSRWEAFHSAILQAKNPENLKVAYLAGPNPENDIEVLTGFGVLPENIWAFESDNTIYTQALISALSSKYPFIKLMKSNVSEYFSVAPQKFDIIYLDFCGPLPSRNKDQKTLNAITQILKHHALTSPGILITNVSLPSEIQDKRGRDLITKLVAKYLYPKQFIENYQNDSCVEEGPICQDLSYGEWEDKVRNNLDEYYGQYVTRLLLDMVSILSPCDRVDSYHSLYKQMFINSNQVQADTDKLYHFNAAGEDGDVIVDPAMYPILWTIASLSKGVNNKDNNYPQTIYHDSNFEKYAKLFLKQLTHKNDLVELEKSISKMSYLLTDGPNQSKFYNKSLMEMNNYDWINSHYLFCDLFLFHQVRELLFRQLALPYHVNIKNSQRWSYKAKDTKMYMDCLVLDECRYLYDWMPSIDMFLSSLGDIERQLSFRFALDGVSKHRRFYTPEMYFGTACVSEDTLGFEAHTLSKRCEIKL